METLKFGRNSDRKGFGDLNNFSLKIELALDML